MKKTILFYKKVASKLLMLLLLLGATLSMAQVQQNVKLTIKDNSVVSVKNYVYNFSNEAETTRNALANGKLLFLAGATVGDTSENKHVNGYASVTGQTDFTFPIGNALVYRPLRIQSATAATRYNAIYQPSDPTLLAGASVDVSLQEISNIEYWDLDQSAASSNVTVSLTYGAGSNAGQLSTVVDNLVVAGYNGSNEWVPLPSSFVSGNITAGTVSATNVDLDTYTKFTIGAKLPCFEVVMPTGANVAWDGTDFVLRASRSPFPPAIFKNLELEANLDMSTDFPPGTVIEAYILDLRTFDVTIGEDQTLKVYGAISGSGSVILESSSASLLQVVDGGTPNIVMNKVATDMKAFDYIYLGAPIDDANYNFGSMPSDALNASGTSVATNVFDLFYTYNNGSNSGSVWTAGSTSRGVGQGIIGRIAPRSPFSSSTDVADVKFTFSGQTNNGDVVVNNPQVSTDANSNTNNILLGNPYPSAIDGVAFLKENEDVDGVLYVWQTGQASGTGGTYSPNDYLAFTLAGSVSTNSNPAGLDPFNGIIPTGQGFKVRVIERIATPEIKFTNCMRVPGNNTQFFKTAGQPIDRFKVNMTGANGVFNQMLIAYMPEGTLSYDRMYDARSFSTSAARLYTFDNAATKLSINARPNFTNTDVVPVGFAKANTNPETFTLSIAEEEGIFTTPNVTVYLHDTVLNTYHNLSAGSYTLTTSQASLDNRFEIVYQNGTLSNEDLEEAVTTISLVDTAFSLDSSNVVKQVQIFDLAGRLIQNYANINASSFNAYFNHAEGVYIARVTYDNGSLGSVKLIHSKQ